MDLHPPPRPVLASDACLGFVGHSSGPDPGNGLVAERGPSTDESQHPPGRGGRRTLATRRRGVGHNGPGPDVAIVGRRLCTSGYADDLVSMINQGPYEWDTDGPGGSCNDHSHPASFETWRLLLRRTRMTSAEAANTVDAPMNQTSAVCPPRS